MAKAAPKTQRTKASVAAFIAAIEDETRRKDARAVDKMMREITRERPTMWGPSIVGYGEYQSPSGAWPRSGFSPRKANLVVYLMAGFAEHEALLKRLGKHKTGKSCLYINKLADVDVKILRRMVEQAWEAMTEKYG